MTKTEENIKKFIKELTDNFYNKYQLQLNEVCKKLGIGCFDADFKDNKISGILVRDKESDSFNIYVNRKHSTTRQRFTIAHELGHYISYKHQSHSYAQLNNNNEIEDYAISFRHGLIQSDAETEANRIAADMLMPEEMIKEMVEKDLTIEEMAELFYVSESAVTIRLKLLYPELMVV